MFWTRCVLNTATLIVNRRVAKMIWVRVEWCDVCDCCCVELTWKGTWERGTGSECMLHVEKWDWGANQSGIPHIWRRTSSPLSLPQSNFPCDCTSQCFVYLAVAAVGKKGERERESFDLICFALFLLNKIKTAEDNRSYHLSDERWPKTETALIVCTSLHISRGSHNGDGINASGDEDVCVVENMRLFFMFWLF